MAPERICPWWLAYFFDHPLRRLVQKPEVILAPYVKEGMTALDLGCGMGFFSLALARMVGEKGGVIAVDLQPQMLKVLESRARAQGLLERIRRVAATPDRIGVSEPVDFALAMWMVHEVPDRLRFLTQVRGCLRPGARFLIAEPGRHVRAKDFQRTLDLAGSAGLELIERPRVGLSRAAVLAPK